MIDKIDEIENDDRQNSIGRIDRIENIIYSVRLYHL